MIITATLSHLELAFEKMGRGNSFTPAGFEALYRLIEQYEDATGELVELNVIDLDCSYTEYDSVSEFNADYDTNYKNTKEMGEDGIVVSHTSEDDNRGFVCMNEW